MGCHAVPALAAIIYYFMRKKKGINSKHSVWLNQLFLGGAIFGVIDHAWNRELLAFTFSDLLLGVMITVGMVGVWGLMVWADKNSVENTVNA